MLIVWRKLNNMKNRLNDLRYIVELNAAFLKDKTTDLIHTYNKLGIFGKSAIIAGTIGYASATFAVGVYAYGTVAALNPNNDINYPLMYDLFERSFFTTVSSFVYVGLYKTVGNRKKIRSYASETYNSLKQKLFEKK